MKSQGIKLFQSLTYSTIMLTSSGKHTINNRISNNNNIVYNINNNFFPFDCRKKHVLLTCCIEFPRRSPYKYNFHFRPRTLARYPDYRLLYIHTVYIRSARNRNDFRRTDRICHPSRPHDIGTCLRNYTANSTIL